MKKLILGATGSIGSSLSRKIVSDGGEVHLVGRDEKSLSDLASELYSSDNLLLGKYFRYNRSPVKFDELSDELITTLLVTEDIRFYDHSGIDFKGLVRATYGLAKNIITFGNSPESEPEMIN